jgi:hypothetical protein
MTRKTLVAVSVAFLCCSCSRQLLIEPSGSGTEIALKFYTPGPFWRGTMAPKDYPAEPCISKLSVIQEQSRASSTPRTVWQISAKNGCVDLDEIVIGKVPFGFVETVSKLPLDMGATYRVIAARSGAPGTSKPWVVCPGAPEVRRWTERWQPSSPPSCTV